MIVHSNLFKPIFYFKLGEEIRGAVTLYSIILWLLRNKVITQAAEITWKETTTKIARGFTNYTRANKSDRQVLERAGVFRAGWSAALITSHRRPENEWNALGNKWAERAVGQVPRPGVCHFTYFTREEPSENCKGKYMVAALLRTTREL